MTGTGDGEGNGVGRTGGAPPVRRETLPSGGWTILPDAHGSGEEQTLTVEMELDPLPTREEADALLGGTYGDFAEDLAGDAAVFGASSLELLDAPPVGRGADRSDPHARASFGARDESAIDEVELLELGDDDFLEEPPSVQPTPPADVLARDASNRETASRTTQPTDPAAVSTVGLPGGAVLRPARRYSVPSIAVPPDEVDARRAREAPAAWTNPRRSASVAAVPDGVAAGARSPASHAATATNSKDEELFDLPGDLVEVVEYEPPASAGFVVGRVGASAHPSPAPEPAPVAAPQRPSGEPTPFSNAAIPAAAIPDEVADRNAAAVDGAPQDDALGDEDLSLAEDEAPEDDAPSLTEEDTFFPPSEADTAHDETRPPVEPLPAAAIPPAFDPSMTSLGVAVGRMDYETGRAPAREPDGGIRPPMDSAGWDVAVDDFDAPGVRPATDPRRTMVTPPPVAPVESAEPVEPAEPEAPSASRVTVDAEAAPAHEGDAAEEEEVAAAPVDAEPTPEPVEQDAEATAEPVDEEATAGDAVADVASEPVPPAAAVERTEAVSTPGDAFARGVATLSIAPASPRASATVERSPEPVRAPRPARGADEHEAAPVGNEDTTLPPPTAPDIALAVEEPEGGVPDGRNTWFGRPEVFRSYTQGLARMGRWRQIAQVTGWAALHAPWATASSQASMLLDLARLYRDRLDDETRAEEAFRAVLRVDPGNVEATTWLLDAARARGDWRAVVQQLLSAAEATWDAQQRLESTREAAQIAQVQLGDESLVIECWERLWRSGDAGSVAVRELGRSLRRARRWKDLATAMGRRMEESPSSVSDLLALESVPVWADGVGDTDAALALLDRIEQQGSVDAGLVAERIDLLIRRQDHAALEEMAGRLRDPASVRRVADALWDQQNRAAAARVYTRLRAEGHRDAELEVRLDAWFAASELPKERVDLLLERAAHAADPEQRASWLEEAATVVEEVLGEPARALALLTEAGTLREGSLDRWLRRAALARRVGDVHAEIEALEGALTHGPDRATRRDAHTRLATALAADPEGHERAREHADVALQLDASDATLWDLRRSLDEPEHVAPATELVRWQARVHACPPGDAAVATWTRAAAETAIAGVDDPIVRGAWVLSALERAPDDTKLIDAWIASRRGAGAERAHAFWMEWRDGATKQLDPADIVALADHDAAHDDPSWGHAMLERAVASSAEPDRATVLALADRYRAAGQMASARALLEAAIATSAGGGERTEWLRTLSGWVDDDDTVRQEELLRRRDLLGDPTAFDALYQLAERTGSWSAVVERLQAQLLSADDESSRQELLLTLSSVLSRTESNRARAWSVALSAVVQPSERSAAIDVLLSLAVGAGRVEDLLGVLEAKALRADTAATRRDALRERVRICRDVLEDTARTFAELRRLVELDPSDEESLRQLQAAAVTPALELRLRYVLQSLTDHTNDSSLRDRLWDARLALAEKAGDAVEALEVRLLRLRLQPLTAASLHETLEGRPEAVLAALPLIEGRSLGEPGTAAERAQRCGWVAEQWEAASPRSLRGVELRALALLLRASAQDAVHDAEALATFVDLVRDGAWARDGEAALRIAAGLHPSTEARVALWEAALRVAPHGEGESSIAIHRCLYDTNPSHAASVRALAAWASTTRWSSVRYAYLEAETALCTDSLERARMLDRLAVAALGSLQDEALCLDLRIERLALAPSEEVEHAIRQLGDRARSVEVRRRVWTRRLQTAPEQARAAIARPLALLHDQADRSVEAAECWAIVAEEEGVDSDAAERSAALQEALGEAHAMLRLEARRYCAASLDPGDALEQGCGLLRRLRATSGVCAAESGAVLAHMAEAASPGDTTLRPIVERDELAARGDWDAWTRTFREVPASGWERRLKARVLWHHLDRRADAVALWRGERTTDPAGSAFFQAYEAAQGTRWQEWFDHRMEAARALPDPLAAVALCFLAEAADDLGRWHDVSISLDTADLYREARRLDASLPPAQEALRAIGRRLRSLRPAASLLPEEGEEVLPWNERADRLAARAHASSDSSERLEWARRAAICGADRPEMWTLLGDAAAAVGRRDEAAVARRLGWDARERTIAPQVDVLAHEAELLLQLSTTLRMSEEIEEADAVLAEAAAIATQSSRALAAWLDAGVAVSEVELAVRVELALTGVHAEEPNDPEAAVRAARLLAERAERSSSPERARADLEEALRWDRCNPRACAALAEEPGREGEAVRWLAHALAFESDGERRASLYRALGALRSGAARGAAFELAWLEGAADRATLREVLHHYEATDRGMQALEIVDSLISEEHEPAELARLWAVRGSILSAAGDADETAIEAFDMALSYDPSSTDARLGLASMFERRKDWEQLLPLLEVMVETTPPDERPLVLRRIGRIALGIPGEEERGEAALREALSLSPDRETVALLERRACDRDASSDERLALLGQLVAFGPPWYAHAYELGRQRLDAHPRLAWALLSPILMTRGVDEDLKSRLREMRRDHERPPVLVRPTSSPRPSSPLDALRHWFDHVASALGLADRSVASLGVDDVSEVSRLSSVGRQFQAIADARGLPDLQLLRGTTRAPLEVVREDGVTRVIVRSDLFQQMARAEVGFLLAAACERAHPHHVGVALVGEDTCYSIVRALWVVAGHTTSERTGVSPAFVERVRAVFPDGLPETFGDDVRGGGTDPATVATALLAESRRAAWRAGLVAGADVYQVMRLFARIDEESDRVSLFPAMDQIDEAIGASTDVADLMAYACSSEFSEALRSWTEVTT